jgi:hypothetical protein
VEWSMEVIVRGYLCVEISSPSTLRSDGGYREGFMVEKVYV